MNCKHGLALIKKSTCGNEGKIVFCMQYVGRVNGLVGNDYWKIDRPLISKRGDFYTFFRDSWMIPIKDPGEDAQDESKAWLPPVPTKETA
jgi:hypothetical protein